MESLDFLPYALYVELFLLQNFVDIPHGEPVWLHKTALHARKPLTNVFRLV